jgi:hypothetical protein
MLDFSLLERICIFLAFGYFPPILARLGTFWAPKWHQVFGAKRITLFIYAERT